MKLAKLIDWFYSAQVRHVDIVDPGDAQLLQAKKYRALPKFPREAGHPWATIWPGPEHVIFGHHARRRLQVAPCI